MNYRHLTTALLLLALAFFVGFAFSSILPGPWFAWLGSCVGLVIAGAAASNEADKAEGKA